MNRFSDESLTREFNEAIGPSDSTPEGEPGSRAGNDSLAHERFKTELETLQDNPFGLIGRRLYRRLMKRWPKPDENYDWVYAPSELESTAVDASEVPPSVTGVNNESKLKAPLKQVPVLRVLHDQGAAESSHRGAEQNCFVLDLGVVIEPLETNSPKKHPAVELVNAVGVDKADSKASHSKGKQAEYWSLQHRFNPVAYKCPKGQTYSGAGIAAPRAGSGGLWKTRGTPEGKNISREQQIDFLKRSTLSRCITKLPSGRPFIMVNECHRTEISLTLEALDYVVRALTDVQSVAYVGKPRTPFNTAREYLFRIFKGAEEGFNAIARNAHYRGGAAEPVSVEWRLDPEAGSRLAVKGSAGGVRDYWFKMHNHQLSLMCQDVAEKRPPHTIFQVLNDEPASAGGKMLDALKRQHMEDQAPKLIGTLKDFVALQSRAH
ncbi:hypothetical protein [Pseudomonas hunanensis]|uniref:hypothetical protein n=1 Tax=Pseudomonas hunanensis TaxID=1247546 RepID=UPI0030D7A8E6